MKKRLPNILTISRVFLTFGFIAVLLKGETVISAIIAIVLFTLASLTDYYDGYFAKKHDVISDFGRIADPIADKFLILATLFVFLIKGYVFIESWMFYLIFAREIIVTVFRFFAISKGKVLAAESAGKLKTVFQITTISVALMFILVERAVYIVNWLILNICNGIIYALLVITVFLTLYSGFFAVWKNRKVFL